MCVTEHVTAVSVLTVSDTISKPEEGKTRETTATTKKNLQTLHTYSFMAYLAILSVG